MKKTILLSLMAFVAVSGLLIALSGCTVVVKRPPRPAAKIEVRPAAPGPTAVWVAGHWKWKDHRRRGRWIWIPGHWKRR